MPLEVHSETEKNDLKTIEPERRPLKLSGALDYFQQDITTPNMERNSQPLTLWLIC